MAKCVPSSFCNNNIEKSIQSKCHLGIHVKEHLTLTPTGVTSTVPERTQHKLPNSHMAHDKRLILI